MSAYLQGGGFPSQVNVVPAPAVAGDFASTNPRNVVDAGAGQFVSGVNGVTVGAFAWIDPVLSNNLNSYGQGAPVGFIHRAQQALITQFLGYQAMVVPQGLGVTAFTNGDFWVVNSGSTTSAYGMSAYALNASGLVAFGTSVPVGASCTSGTVAKIVTNATPGVVIGTTNTCTASINNNLMTVTAVGANAVLGAGQVITGTGIDPAATVTILSQSSGTTGGVGVYVISLDFAGLITSTTITMSGAGMTVTGANVSGFLAVGQVLTGTNVPSGFTILGFGTGTGAAGTYYGSVVATSASASQATVTNAMFLTVDASSTGVWTLNDAVTGTGISGSYITATNVQNSNLTGLGGAGTYFVSGYYTAVSAEAISSPSGTATTWVATSVGAPGELVKFRNTANI